MRCKNVTVISGQALRAHKWRMTGMEIIEEISKIAPGTKAIFISGYTPETIHKKGILPSEMEFITKPFKKDELLRKVREVLDKN